MYFPAQMPNPKLAGAKVLARLNGPDPSELSLEPKKNALFCTQRGDLEAGLVRWWGK
jgi:hypothetical protein